jgi:hypothetical protein
MSHTLTLQVVLPTLAVLRLAVMDENNRLLGHRVLPVDGLRPGMKATQLGLGWAIHVYLTKLVLI